MAGLTRESRYEDLDTRPSNGEPLLIGALIGAFKPESCPGGTSSPDYRSAAPDCCTALDYSASPLTGIASTDQTGRP